MNKNPHFDILKNALQEHERHRVQEIIKEATEQFILRTDKGFDLSDTDLSHFDLSGLDFRRANFNRSKLYSTKLKNVNLDGCSMICPGLERTDFSKASLRGAYLHAFSAQVCNFTNAHLDNIVDCTGSIFHGCNMKGCSFVATQLAGSTFYQCDLSDSNFFNANLQGCYFNESILFRLNFFNSQLGQVVFTKCMLDNVNFNNTTGHCVVIQRPTSCDNISVEQAYLPYLRLDSVNGSNWHCCGLNAPGLDCISIHLEKADFSNSNLFQSRWLSSLIHDGNFYAAKIEENNWCHSRLVDGDMSLTLLENTKFTECDLSKTKMVGLKGRCLSIRDSNLSFCNLTDAYLYRAFITGDPPKGMSLIGVKLTNANLVQAYIAANLTGAHLINTLLTYARFNQSVLTESTITGGNYYQACFIKVDFTDAIFSGFNPPAFFDRCTGLMEIINKESQNGERETAISYLTDFQKTLNMVQGSST